MNKSVRGVGKILGFHGFLVCLWLNLTCIKIERDLMLSSLACECLCKFSVMSRRFMAQTLELKVNKRVWSCTKI